MGGERGLDSEISCMFQSSAAFLPRTEVTIVLSSSSARTTTITLALTPTLTLTLTLALTQTQTLTLTLTASDRSHSFILIIRTNNKNPRRAYKGRHPDMHAHPYTHTNGYLFEVFGGLLLLLLGLVVHLLLCVGGVCGACCVIDLNP